MARIATLLVFGLLVSACMHDDDSADPPIGPPPPSVGIKKVKVVPGPNPIVLTLCVWEVAAGESFLQSGDAGLSRIQITAVVGDDTQTATVNLTAAQVEALNDESEVDVPLTSGSGLFGPETSEVTLQVILQLERADTSQAEVITSLLLDAWPGT